MSDETLDTNEDSEVAVAVEETDADNTDSPADAQPGVTQADLDELRTYMGTQTEALTRAVGRAQSTFDKAEKEGTSQTAEAQAALEAANAEVLGIVKDLTTELGADGISPALAARMDVLLKEHGDKAEARRVDTLIEQKLADRAPVVETPDATAVRTKLEQDLAEYESELNQEILDAGFDPLDEDLFDFVAIAKQLQGPTGSRRKATQEMRRQLKDAHVTEGAVTDLASKKENAPVNARGGGAVSSDPFDIIGEVGPAFTERKYGALMDLINEA
jgi:hypothetical protein